MATPTPAPKARPIPIQSASDLGELFSLATSAPLLCLTCLRISRGRALRVLAYRFRLALDAFVRRGAGTSLISMSQPTAWAYFLSIVTEGECLPVPLSAVS